SSVHIGNRYNLYKGQQIQIEELEHLKSNIGKLLCITTFMSVTSSGDSACKNINNDESVEQLPSKIWYIKLQLTDKEIDDSKILLDLFKNDFGDKITFLTCGMFWAKVNKCEKALDYYNKLLENSLLPNNQKITVLNNLALIYEQEKRFETSRDYFTRALELTEHSTPSPDLNITIETNDVILKQAIANDSTFFTVCYNLGCSIYEQ
ncbi:unnamed protein product, partial [Didymodactylos carnosus]